MIFKNVDRCSEQQQRVVRKCPELHILNRDETLRGTELLQMKLVLLGGGEPDGALTSTRLFLLQTFLPVIDSIFLPCSNLFSSQQAPCDPLDERTPHGGKNPQKALKGFCWRPAAALLAWWDSSPHSGFLRLKAIWWEQKSMHHTLAEICGGSAFKVLLPSEATNGSSLTFLSLSSVDSGEAAARWKPGRVTDGSRMGNRQLEWIKLLRTKQTAPSHNSMKTRNRSAQ